MKNVDIFPLITIITVLSPWQCWSWRRRGCLRSGETRRRSCRRWSSWRWCCTGWSRPWWAWWPWTPTGTLSAPGWTVAFDFCSFYFWNSMTSVGQLQLTCLSFFGLVVRVLSFKIKRSWVQFPSGTYWYELAYLTTPYYDFSWAIVSQTIFKLANSLVIIP